ncbi:MAG: hypothetical protein ABWU13_23820, partial [Limnospira maxima]
SYEDAQERYPYIQIRSWNPHRVVISGISALFHTRTSRTIRLHFSLLRSYILLRTYEGFKRSVYTGIPSLDLSCPPG